MREMLIPRGATLRILVDSYRRFGAACRLQFQSSLYELEVFNSQWRLTVLMMRVRLVCFVTLSTTATDSRRFEAIYRPSPSRFKIPEEYLILPVTQIMKTKVAC
jgi:hypothetical protein